MAYPGPPSKYICLIPKSPIKNPKSQLTQTGVSCIEKEKQLWSRLWTLIPGGMRFHTVTGLQFSYEIRKGRSGEYTKELWIDRRGESKSLTMSTVLKAYENSIGAGIVERPKALGDLHGVSYIYPIFFRFGLIEVPEKVKEILRGRKK